MDEVFQALFKSYQCVGHIPLLLFLTSIESDGLHLGHLKQIEGKKVHIYLK